ncbi:biotin--[acetyl-CoA-carboxylase] ligase [Ureibacillus acetophenoni]|uniref:Bifunctional ligase/repressor BirA n=1 Tax=Ureibacillus acetophenoni TaxID=614649 RepID=A0A285U7F2_9BACL|nr:biotin--[acetyl-CoA-carboxylase] ligase [Ureibacillus acetophenoni]SOC37653.1 BirA family biotin operon repressor/biotin-[acetyl-CoA-carboxylase] ligase [Ureibacillus acetophenoni]
MNLTTKDELLSRFLKADNEPLSGQQLADEFGISRTAIWKHLQTLQDEGYTFETIKKKGYLLTSKPDRVDPARISSYLTTTRLGHHVHYYDEVTSTQTIAHELVRNGAEDGTVVVAETQTAGKGRMARPWESTKGKGIWMTIIIRPNILPHQAPQFTLIAAVAVVNAIRSLYESIQPEIKWPNDILLNGKKCTGILTEMIAEMDGVQALLIGIGINVNQELEDFPDELKNIATSLSIEANNQLDRAELIAKILHYLEKYSDIYLDHGFEPIKTLWEEFSGTIGKKIKATTLREVVEGTAIGITEDGVLEVRIDDGEIKRIYSADIEIE